MPDNIIEKLQRANHLYQSLSDFILEAEGELAVCLEKFSAEKLAKLSPSQGIHNHQMVLDLFTTEGNINYQTPIDIYIQQQTDLNDVDRQILQQWYRSFVGLFTVEKISENGLILKNWLTAKIYHLQIKNKQEEQQLARIKPGEILLTRISPLDAEKWIFSGPFTLMGKLGKPKLAIAIGNFKQNFPNYLYADAPELLQEAWLSVEWYHQQFLNYFGSTEITMSGKELAVQLKQFQQQLAEKRLEKVGIDTSKSLQQLATESGISDSEMQTSLETMGIDSQTSQEIFQHPLTSKMVTPKVELPPHILHAQTVTTVSHPQWGQVFLTDYLEFTHLLASTPWQKTPEAEKIVREYLSKPEVHPGIWQNLAKKYPRQLEIILQDILNCPDWELESDLHQLLQQYNKPPQPQLPEIASVPIHLHNLFEEALLEVNRKNKSKNKSKTKSKTGFQL